LRPPPATPTCGSADEFCDPDAIRAELEQTLATEIAAALSFDQVLGMDRRETPATPEQLAAVRARLHAR
jgi:hypothetical protein